MHTHPQQTLCSLLFGKGIFRANAVYIKNVCVGRRKLYIQQRAMQNYWAHPNKSYKYRNVDYNSVWMQYYGLVCILCEYRSGIALAVATLLCCCHYAAFGCGFLQRARQDALGNIFCIICTQSYFKIHKYILIFSIRRSNVVHITHVVLRAAQ